MPGWTAIAIKVLLAPRSYGVRFVVVEASFVCHYFVVSDFIHLFLHCLLSGTEFCAESQNLHTSF